MKQETAITYLEAEWEEPQGFFYRLRQGEYSPQEAARVLEMLAAIGIDEEAPLERRLVSLLWYLPLFSQWQRERVQEAGTSPHVYEQFINKLTNILEEKLGVP